MNETNDINGTAKLDQLVQMMQNLTENQARQDEKINQLMERVNVIDQTALSTQNLAQETERKEQVEGKAMENASRAFATLQQAEVADATKVDAQKNEIEATVKSVNEEEKHLQTLETEVASTLDNDQEFKHVIQDDLKQAADEFNNLEAEVTETRERQENSDTLMDVMKAGLERFAQDQAQIQADARAEAQNNQAQNLEAIQALAKEIQQLKSSPNGNAAAPPRDAPPPEANARAARPAQWRDDNPRANRVEEELQRLEMGRFDMIKRNVPTLILEANATGLSACTKRYDDTPVKYATDFWVTLTNDMEDQLVTVQRQLTTARIRFEDWNIHLSAVCTKEVNKLIHDSAGRLFPWPRAVYALLAGIDYRQRQYKVMLTLESTWPSPGENLWEFFDKFFAKARSITEFPVYQRVNVQVQNILCNASTSLVGSTDIAHLDSIDKLAAYIRQTVHSETPYHGKALAKTDTAAVSLMAVHKRVLRGADAFYCRNCDCDKCRRAKANGDLKKGYCVTCKCPACRKMKDRLAPKTRETAQYRINAIDATQTVTPIILDEEAQHILREIEKHEDNSDSDDSDPYVEMVRLANSREPLEELAACNIESYDLDEVGTDQSLRQSSA